MKLKAIHFGMAVQLSKHREDWVNLKEAKHADITAAIKVIEGVPFVVLHWPALGENTRCIGFANVRSFDIELPPEPVKAAIACPVDPDLEIERRKQDQAKFAQQVGETEAPAPAPKATRKPKAK